MGRRFTTGTPLAALELQMMMVPNFTSRGHGRHTLHRYRPSAADVDCQYCVHCRRRRCQSETCPYLAERLEAEAVTLKELTLETIRPWPRTELNKRIQRMVRRMEALYFTGVLHMSRMQDVVGKTGSCVDNKWLAAIYLLSAHTELWNRTFAAIWRGQIDFAYVRLRGVSTQDYVLYRVAKGILTGEPGVTPEELADKALVKDDALQLVFSAMLIARYGPEVMKVGRAER